MTTLEQEAARRAPAVGLVALMLLAFVLFQSGVGIPSGLLFDETHYVRAAHAVFDMTHPVNPEHPLLAKWLIGLSMFLFGDTAAGWRQLSVMAGVATVGCVYWIAYRLFDSVEAAAMTALLTILDQFVFVQARIAMLDVYMGMFLFAAAAIVIESARWRRQAGDGLALGGVCMGLAIGCKWAALPCAAAIGACFLGARLMAARRDGALPWPGVSTPEGATILAAFAAVAYLLTFLPAFFYAEEPLTLGGLLPWQLHMLAEQTAPLRPHPAQSDWWTWPFLFRPIWMLHEVTDGALRGVLLVGNPVICWGGLFAVPACLWAGVRRSQPVLLLAGGAWLFAFGMWGVIPKKIGFLYYYYVPAILLGFAIVGAFEAYCREGRMRAVPPLFIAAAAAMFGYFYPILSAMPIEPLSHVRWVWFDSWR